MTAGDGINWRRMTRITAIGFAICTLLGVVFATQLTLFYSQVQGVPFDWLKAARYFLPTWYSWGLLTPLIVWITRRWPPQWNWRSALTHFAAAIVLILLHVLISASVLWTLERGTSEAMPWLRVARYQLLSTLHLDVLIYVGVVGCVLARVAQRESRERQVRAAQLESQLSEARLSTLRAQLRPHFLFNTLNAIAALVRENPAMAERMIVDFSELLRAAIDERRDRVRLREEFLFARRYLEIEQTRFGERLQVRWDLSEDTMEQSAPYLLLQPLIENAVRHGLAARTGACAIEVSSRRDNGQIVLTVRDDGPGMSKDTPQREGLGLRATRARLAEMFGERYQLSLANAPHGGCVAEVRIPFVDTSHDEEGA